MIPKASSFLNYDLKRQPYLKLGELELFLVVIINFFPFLCFKNESSKSLQFGRRY